MPGTSSMAKNEDPAENRAVFVDENTCIGCKQCVWHAPACFRCAAFLYLLLRSGVGVGVLCYVMFAYLVCLFGWEGLRMLASVHAHASVCCGAGDQCWLTCIEPAC